MKIDINTKFVIYGARVQGKEILKILTSVGFSTVAFIDKNAHEIQSQEGISVYPLEHIPKLLESYKELVVVISVNNVFTHVDIAKTLIKKGVRYIICKNVYGQNSNAKWINDLYDELTDSRAKQWHQSVEIPLFAESLTEFEVLSGNDGSENLLCQVPIELLFGLTKDYYFNSLEVKDKKIINLCADRSILYYSIPRDLYFYWVNGVQNNRYEQSVQFYLHQRRYTFGMLDIDKDKELQHIRDKYNIFQNMEMLYNSNMSFFFENPSRVVWNSGGYFNIEDGNNRAAFLMAKGWNAIPCNMSFSDYKKWIHEEAVLDVEHLKLIDKLVYPIPHPYYNKKICTFMPYAVEKLKKICEWMYINKIETHGLKILDVSCKNGYFGFCFARMGAEAILIETEEEYFELCRAVNNLFYSKVEGIYSSFEQLKSKDYDIAFIPAWGSTVIEKIKSISCKYIIMDVIDKDKIDHIKMLVGKARAQVLCKLICNGEIVHIVILAE